MKTHKQISESLKQDFSDGDLCLGIYCKRCDARFELSKEAAALATMLQTPFWEYVCYVQHSKCPSCNVEGKNDH